MPRQKDFFALALRDLAVRERTAAELRQWLARRGVSRAEQEAVLDRLEQAGAIDDRRFAHRFAEDKRQLAGWGEIRIGNSLERRGVAAELIEEALTRDGGESELDRAVAALARLGGDLSSDPERQRALAFLVRRGYELDLAYDAVRRGARAA